MIDSWQRALRESCGGTSNENKQWHECMENGTAHIHGRGRQNQEGTAGQGMRTNFDQYSRRSLTGRAQQSKRTLRPRLATVRALGEPNDPRWDPRREELISAPRWNTVGCIQAALAVLDIAADEAAEDEEILEQIMDIATNMYTVKK